MAAKHLFQVYSHYLNHPDGMARLVGVRSVAGRFMLGGIDQLVRMGIPTSQLACELPPLAWLFVELV
jgi:hypothetical protein